MSVSTGGFIIVQQNRAEVAVAHDAASTVASTGRSA
jgi:hypothetical protein